MRCRVHGLHCVLQSQGDIDRGDAQSALITQEAQADLDAVEELDPFNMKAAALRRKLSRTAVQGKGSEAAVFAKMFDKNLHVQDATLK